MKKDVFPSIELVVLTQDDPAMQTTKLSMEGRLSKNSRTNSYTFVETKARKHNAEHPRLFESTHLFLTQLVDGRFQIYLKRISFDHHGIDATALGSELAGEIAQAVKVAGEIAG